MCQAVVIIYRCFSTIDLKKSVQKAKCILNLVANFFKESGSFPDIANKHIADHNLDEKYYDINLDEHRADGWDALPCGWIEPAVLKMN